MVIVCGIDGSATSREAARAAAAIAKLEQATLLLVNVQEALVMNTTPVAGVLTDLSYLEDDRTRMRDELEREAERIRPAFGIEVKIQVRTGLPDQELAKVAEQEDADLLVIAALGRRTGAIWRLGSVADRLSQRSPVPLLVVRDSRPFERWAFERAPLTTALALGTGKPTRVAAEAVAGLTRLGPVVVTEAHVYDPVEEARKRGLADPQSLDVRVAIESSLARELPPHGVPETVGGQRNFVAIASRGQVPETLAEFVDHERFDLLVLGAHRHGALGRRFFGSVSYSVLAMVGTNALMVPPEVVKRTRIPVTEPRRVQRILVATDLSDAANRAVEAGLGVLPEGGQLLLLYVETPQEQPLAWLKNYYPARKSEPEERMTREQAETELEGLARLDTGRPFEALVEVVESNDVAQAILEAAERHEVDLVCLGTHHKGRVASALIGSVARTVSRRSTRPVLLVPED